MHRSLSSAKSGGWRKRYGQRQRPIAWWSRTLVTLLAKAMREARERAAIERVCVAVAAAAVGETTERETTELCVAASWLVALHVVASSLRVLRSAPLPCIARTAHGTRGSVPRRRTNAHKSSVVASRVRRGCHLFFGFPLFARAAAEGSAGANGSTDRRANGAHYDPPGTCGRARWLRRQDKLRWARGSGGNVRRARPTFRRTVVAADDRPASARAFARATTRTRTPADDAADAAMQLTGRYIAQM